MSETSSGEKNGISFPIGSTLSELGTNFSLFSRNCTGVDLLLFNSIDDISPARVIRLDPLRNRTYHYWHIFVPGIQKGQLYGYRINGPFDKAAGHRFDPGKVLLDPYARAVAVPEAYDRILLSQPGHQEIPSMKSVVVSLSEYDWEADTHPGISFAKTIIYEMHVEGITKNPNSGVAPEKRGTYSGLVEKIPYLKDLGITAVELLPVFQFDNQDSPTGVNYWGYSPVSFFAPHHAYSQSKDPLKVLDEFRDMVKALHKAGIEVILDVVYNHTAECGETGPTFSLKGIDNSIYYILENDKSQYSNFSGTGNTLNANNPVVRRMIIDSLHFWVKEMHIDGFRFDLASILSRDEDGRPIENPPVLWDIESDPLLAGTKLMAEAWDAAGLYQVGSFIGDSWREWNGKFRDDVRSFMRSDNGTVSKFASRILGSPDVFGHENREAEQSINFIACHDGFTLNDLVSYNSKHNMANGEENRDGGNENFSWNCGIEGPSDDPVIEGLRSRQVKNYLALTLLSLGAPMILMGDEVRRTQDGNNNAYCHDDKIAWFDWDSLNKYADIHRFTKQLIKIRLIRDSTLEEYSMTLMQMINRQLVTWHGVKLFQPDWTENSHSLAFTVKSLSGRMDMHFMVNAYWESLEFEVPESIGDTHCMWKVWIDTSAESPGDIHELTEAPALTERKYNLCSHSLVVLIDLRK
jgi:isoamylase